MSHVKLLLIVAGQAIEDVATSHGDFDAWFAQGFKGLADLTVCHVHKGEALPSSLDGLDGVVISGSSSSVTEWEGWMETTADFIRRCADVDLPLLGVCFGHQLMGRALGGRVTQNPAGREIGTVEVVLTRSGSTDPVLGPLVPSFRIQATHVDSVVQPPEGAEVLARTAQENCAAMRVGRNLYGVQFHPEMSAAVLKRYISQRAKLIDGERGPGGADKVYAAVTETRAGDVILKRFISEVVKPYQASGRKEVKPQSNLAEPPRRVRSHARAQDVYQEHFATADDGQPIFYNEVGKGAPAIMCFDGVGCDQYAWKYMVEGMKERHHVLRWNYAGHGRTPAPRDWPQARSNRLSVEGLADDAIRVMDHAGVDAAVLCGHSLGVQVALETWHRHPSRVTALVLMCGSYGRPLRTFHNRSDMERALPVIRTVLGLAPSVSRAVWRRVVQSEVAYQFALTMEVNRQMVKRRDFGPYFTHLAGVDPILFAEMVGHANAHTAEAFLKDVSVPTLVVAGENDTFTPAYLSQHMQQAIPGAQLLTVPKGTHTAPIEIPELITLRVEKFLKERVVDPDPAAASKGRKRAPANGAPAGM